MTWKKLKNSIPPDRHIDAHQLKEAYQFARFAHKHQKRHTGEEYITHPLQVAQILVSWHLNQTILEAALLHDTVEETPVTLQEIESQFGKEVAFLVDGVTKVGSVQLRNKVDHQFLENLRKMFIYLAKDVRVVMIRLADRLHNMQTLDAVPISKQKRIARETLQIYAPLAERLGMGHIKGQLEDLAFPFVYPRQHQWLQNLAHPHLKRTKQIVQKAINKLQTKLDDHSISADIHGRAKHQYSLYKKLSRPEIQRDITKVHDLVALRIITNSKADCYAALGSVHDLWKPVPHLGISDFIAQPKPNGYQSIHTKVFDHTGHIIEVQIRTKKMHHHAEFGAAAHFAYSEAKNQGATSQQLDQGQAFSLPQKLNWIKQLADWQKQVQNSQEFITDLQLDALSERIYVFSPKGDVFDLPQGATPVDFACSVHTNLIQYIQAAQVNGKLVTLDQSLKSGDVVKILKTKQPRLPTRDWLQFIKTSQARRHIKKLLKIP